MSLSEAPARPSLPTRILRATPIVGTVIRDVERDINSIFYLVTIFVTLVVLAVQTWGLAALVLTAVAAVPMMFVLIFFITLP